MNQHLRPTRLSNAIEQVVDDELVVYNLDTDGVHLLNPTVAAVWRHCNGSLTIPELGDAVGFDTDIVWVALTELEGAGLLQDHLEAPPRHLSRRQLMKRIAIGAVAIPVVTSIVAPTAAAAASGPCVPNGGSCASPGQCCSGVCSGGVCTSQPSCIPGRSCFYRPRLRDWYLHSLAAPQRRPTVRLPLIARALRSRTCAN